MRPLPAALLLASACAFGGSATVGAPPGEAAITGMPPPILINVLCQTFTSPGEEALRATDMIYASYPPVLPSVSLDIPPSRGKVYEVSVSLDTTDTTNGVWLSVPGPRSVVIDGVTRFGYFCETPFSPGRTIFLEWVATGVNLSPGVGILLAKTFSLISPTPIPTDAFDVCLRTVFMRVRYAAGPFSVTFPLRVTAYSRAHEFIVSAASSVTARQTGCDGTHTHVTPPLTTPIVPSSVDTSRPFISYTDSRCTARTTTFIFPTLAIPVADSRSFLGSYQFDCERLTPAAGNPIALIPAGRCVIAIFGGTSLAALYPVFLLGRGITVTEGMPAGLGPVTVTWRISPPNTAGFYALCVASGGAGGVGSTYSLGFFIYYPGGIPSASMLVGPAPAWTFTACLRSLTNDPTGLPDTVGRYRLLISAVTRVPPTGPYDSGSVYGDTFPVPFRMEFPCPAALSSSFSNDTSAVAASRALVPAHNALRAPQGQSPTIKLAAPPSTITWRLNCPASMAAAPSAIPGVISELISGLVAGAGATTALVNVESVVIGVRCANCVVRIERLGFVETVVVGVLRFNPSPPNSNVIPQREIFPTITVNDVLTPISPAYATCSSTFPDRGGSIQTAAFGAITTSSAGFGPIAWSQTVGNVAATALYPTCYPATVQFFPSDRLGPAGVRGNFSFVIDVMVRGYPDGVSPLTGTAITRSITFPLSLIISTDTCTGPVASYGPTIPSFIVTGVTWRSARCPGARTALFRDTGFALIGGDGTVNGVRFTGTQPRGAFYFQAGVTPPEAPWSVSRWVGNGTSRSYCVVRASHSDPRPSWFIYASTSRDIMGEQLILPWSTPLLLFSETRVPSSAFVACIQDLFLVHDASYPGAELPSSIDLTATAIRVDDGRFVTADNSLTIRFGPSPVCTTSTVVQGESVILDDDKAAVAKVVAPAVVVPAVVIALAVAAVIGRKKWKAKRAAATSSSAAAAPAAATASSSSVAEASAVEMTAPSPAAAAN
jgi:hypothetical protein